MGKRKWPIVLFEILYPMQSSAIYIQQNGNDVTNSQVETRVKTILKLFSSTKGVMPLIKNLIVLNTNKIIKNLLTMADIRRNGFLLNEIIVRKPKINTKRQTIDISMQKLDFTLSIELMVLRFQRSLQFNGNFYLLPSYADFCLLQFCFLKNGNHISLFNKVYDLLNNIYKIFNRYFIAIKGMAKFFKIKIDFQKSTIIFF